MARRDLRRASDQRPPPRLLLAAAAIGGEADFERQHHVDEGLEGDADEQRPDQIDDMPLLKRDRERGDPLLLCAARLEVAAAQLFEPDKTENLQRQPHCEPRVALFSQHFEIRSEEHTSELQPLMRNSYAVICLKKKTIKKTINEALNKIDVVEINKYAYRENKLKKQHK